MLHTPTQLQATASPDTRTWSRRSVAHVALQPGHGVSPFVTSEQDIKGIDELGKIFESLDELKMLLPESLKTWQPPMFVVLGAESTGKSTILERVTMFPLFPKDEGLCTRLPIKIQLRRTYVREAPTIQVINLDTKEEEGEARIISIANGQIDVREVMEELLKKEQGSVSGIISSRMLVLSVSSPDVPTLDLVDLPGIVTTRRKDEPEDLPQQTEKLVEKFIRIYGENAIFLSLCPAGESPRSAKVNEVISEEMQSRTLGVISKCDDISDAKLLNTIPARLLMSSQESVEFKHGWVATMNKALDEDDLEGEDADTEAKLLALQATKELEWFEQKMKVKKLQVDDMKGEEAYNKLLPNLGCNALVSKMNVLFSDFLRRTWAPRTLLLLEAETSRLQGLSDALGLPQADSQPSKDGMTNLRTRAVFRASELLHSSLRTQLARCKTEVLAPLSQKLRSLLSSDIGSPEELFHLQRELLEATARGTRDAFSAVLPYVQPVLLADSSGFKLGRFPKFISLVQDKIETHIGQGQPGKEGEDIMRRLLTEAADACSGEDWIESCAAERKSLEKQIKQVEPGKAKVLELLEVASVRDLKIPELKAAGFTAADLKRAGFPAKLLKGGGFDPVALIAAGYDLENIRRTSDAPLPSALKDGSDPVMASKLPVSLTEWTSQILGVALTALYEQVRKDPEQLGLELPAKEATADYKAVWAEVLKVMLPKEDVLDLCHPALQAVEELLLSAPAHVQRAVDVYVDDSNKISATAHDMMAAAHLVITLAQTLIRLVLGLASKLPQNSPLLLDKIASFHPNLDIERTIASIRNERDWPSEVIDLMPWTGPSTSTSPLSQRGLVGPVIADQLERFYKRGGEGGATVRSPLELVGEIADLACNLVNNTFERALRIAVGVTNNIVTAVVNEFGHKSPEHGGMEFTREDVEVVIKKVVQIFESEDANLQALFGETFNDKESMFAGAGWDPAKGWPKKLFAGQLQEVFFAIASAPIDVEYGATSYPVVRAPTFAEWGAQVGRIAYKAFESFLQKQVQKKLEDASDGGESVRNSFELSSEYFELSFMQHVVTAEKFCSSVASPLCEIVKDFVIGLPLEAQLATDVYFDKSDTLGATTDDLLGVVHQIAKVISDTNRLIVETVPRLLAPSLLHAEPKIREQFDRAIAALDAEQNGKISLSALLSHVKKKAAEKEKEDEAKQVEDKQSSLRLKGGAGGEFVLGVLKMFESLEDAPDDVEEKIIQEETGEGTESNFVKMLVTGKNSSVQFSSVHKCARHHALHSVGCSASAAALVHGRTIGTASRLRTPATRMTRQELTSCTVLVSQARTTYWSR